MHKITVQLQKFVAGAKFADQTRMHASSTLDASDHQIRMSLPIYSIMFLRDLDQLFISSSYLLIELCSQQDCCQLL